MKKKQNPYQKHANKPRLRISRKQWIVGLSILGVVAIIVGIMVAVPLANPESHDGHDHSHDSSSVGDPHAGHNHNHNNSSAAKVRYQIYNTANNTYRLAILNAQGNVVFEKGNLERAPMKETVDEAKGIYSLSWALYKDPAKNGPNDFETIYYNEKTGAVSQLFVAPRACDGVRVAYGSTNQTKVIVQDVFNKKVYYKEYPLPNPYTKGKDIIVGGRLHDNKKTAVISYITNEKGQTGHLSVKLYEK